MVGRLSLSESSEAICEETMRQTHTMILFRMAFLSYQYKIVSFHTGV